MIAKAKGVKGKCDTLVSLIVRSAGECMKCGVTCECPDFPKKHTTGCPLTTSHIVGRRYSATRCYLPNLQSLCFSCHRRFTDWPREFSKWITDTIGSEAYEELQRKAETVTKVDWQEVYDELAAEARLRGVL